MEKLRIFWNDFTKYLNEVWIEVRPHKGRVVWPAFENVKLSTKAVILSSIFLGVFIGAMDFLFSCALKLIISGGSI